ncbi:MAG: hypothetical protein ABIF77_13370 [bacterium]
MSHNDTRENELKPEQFRAVVTLATTGNMPAAAEAAGVSVRTLQRWATLPAFRQEVLAAETEIVRTAARRLGTLAQKALGVLESVMDDGAAADSPRIRAASTVLDTCLRWREATLIEERLQAVERRVGERL